MKRFRLVLFAALGVACALSIHGQAALKPTQNRTAIGWREFFPDFPLVRMGMEFAAAKKAVLKSGVRPVSMPGNVEEMVWNTKFAGIEGRATMLFKPKAGAWEIAVVVYAMERRADVFKAWREKIEQRNGPPDETHEDEFAVSYVWRFKNGEALELRSPTDVNSPVVDIHWVKLAPNISPYR